MGEGLIDRRLSSGGAGAPSGAIRRRRLLERLRLLCACRTGLEAIAASVCAIARDYVGASGASLFWHDAVGEPAGFYHDSATAEIKDLFVTRFDELFSLPDEPNMVSLTLRGGPSIGQLLAPGADAAYLASNVYRHLCVPLGHRHCLDVRIDRAGRGVALLALWRTEGMPFTRRDIDAAAALQAILAKAVMGVGAGLGGWADHAPRAHWLSVGDRTAHFLTDLTGTRLLAISAAAEDLLVRTQLLRQNLPVGREIRAAPGFARQLAAAHVREGGQGGEDRQVGASKATLHLPTAQGRLVAQASRTRSLAAQEQDLLSISLDRQVPVDVLVADHVAALPLTYLQKKLALFAIRGGARRDCGALFGVSEEALKKHLRVIFDTTGAAVWTDLSGLEHPILQSALDG